MSGAYFQFVRQDYFNRAAAENVRPFNWSAPMEDARETTTYVLTTLPANPLPSNVRLVLPDAVRRFVVAKESD